MADIYRTTLKWLGIGCVATSATFWLIVAAVTSPAWLAELEFPEEQLLTASAIGNWAVGLFFVGAAAAIGWLVAASVATGHTAILNAISGLNRTARGPQ